MGRRKDVIPTSALYVTSGMYRRNHRKVKYGGSMRKGNTDGDKIAEALDRLTDTISTILLSSFEEDSDEEDSDEEEYIKRTVWTVAVTNKNDEFLTLRVFEDEKDAKKYARDVEMANNYLTYCEEDEVE